MRASFLSILRCPFCGGGFQFEEAALPSLGRGAFGVLTCSCSSFPVVDGIPIIQRAPVALVEHTLGRAETEGVSIETVVALIRSGDGNEALVRCLVAPSKPKWWRKVFGWKLSHSPFADRMALRKSKETLVRHVLEPRDTIGARAVFDFYYTPGGLLNPDLGHYFVHRFAQPRHLAALALARTLKSNGKPMLDIACGAGHLEHYLALRSDRIDAVGLDINFHQLWIAKHWIAPQAEYVCGDAGVGLPFTDGAFGSAFCADAYHYIGDGVSLLREIERCAPGRPVMLTRVGNRVVMPNEGAERTLPQYLSELPAGDVRVFDEDELVQRYLRSADPFLTPSRPMDEIVDAKWLSFAWNTPAASERAAISGDAVAPHAVGTLRVNPLYVKQSWSAKDETTLRFTFPSTWYAYENHGLLRYCPREATIPGGGADPSAWPDEQRRRLVESFVALGLPERFG